MKWVLLFSLTLGVLFLTAQEKKQLTVEDIYGSTKFLGKTIKGIQWLPDSSTFSYFERNPDTKLNDIYLYNIPSGNKKLILDGASLKYSDEPISMSSYEWLPHQKFLLICGPKKQIWRYSREASFYVYDIKKKKLIALAQNNSSIQNAKISPDGKHVGYVLSNNLYIADIATGKSRALTTDGNSNILNGVFDWVYEEEFHGADAWHWSPDGSKIAFWRMDQTDVKSFVYNLDQLPRYNVAHSIKYPKVGENNSRVKIGVVDINTGKISWMDLGKEKDIYVPRIKWTYSSNELAIERLNRKQNKMELLFANASTGRTRLIHIDMDPCWIDVTNDLYFLKNKEQFIWTSEKSGFRHIYLYGNNGELIKQLTAGDWEVVSVIGIDEKNDWVYFYGKKETPLDQHIYRVKLNGSNLEKISAKSGWHDANFSPDFNYFIDSFSDAKTPTKMMLCNSNGEMMRMLEENNIEVFNEYNMVYPQFLTITTGDGVELNACMFKPVDFNPQKKYPVLFYGYGMPGSQRVVNKWQELRGLWHQLMTEKEYIVFSVDNRGTGGRGKQFKNLAYGDISKWIVNDQIEGAKYFSSLPYVDATRIGIWGWSGGGYLTCHLMTRGTDYFKAGVAVSPVTDFRNYDTIWTERYMGLLSENEQGYKDANVLNYVDLLKGKLLVIHGTGDDNVHFQNSVQLIQKLIEDGKQFDFMMYPNKNHAISGLKTQAHLFNKITEHFVSNL